MTVVSVRKAAKADAKRPQLQQLLAPFGGEEFLFCPGETVAIVADCTLPLGVAAGVNVNPALIYGLKELALSRDVAQVDVLFQLQEKFDFEQALTISGYGKLRGQGLELVDLRREQALPRVSPLGLATDQLAIYQRLLKADVVISVSKFKADQGLLFGGAIANFAAFSPDFQAKLTPELRNRALVDAWSIVCPDLFIVDGLRGSTGYQPQKEDCLLAATDPLALDTVLAVLSGINPGGVEYLCLGTQYALGHSHPGEIIISGDDLKELINK
ncbi:MAG: DUF362 domain-containing protein [Clostridiales bacterium]